MRRTRGRVNKTLGETGGKRFSAGSSMLRSDLSADRCDHERGHQMPQQPYEPGGSATKSSSQAKSRKQKGRSRRPTTNWLYGADEDDNEDTEEEKEARGGGRCLSDRQHAVMPPGEAPNNTSLLYIRPRYYYNYPSTERLRSQESWL